MHERNDHTDRYLVSYADMVTLLVGVFVVLSTTFRADADRYRMLMRAASQVFGSVPTADSTASTAGWLEAALSRLSPTDVQHDSTTYRCILAEEVLFESGSSRLSETARSGLVQLAEVLQRGNATITIDGHSDSRPSAAGHSNLALSVERALSVARVLMEAGVPEHRIVVRGFGARKPLAPDVASVANRRVEILISFDT
jgi:flagellar motor protein MotB